MTSAGIPVGSAEPPCSASHSDEPAVAALSRAIGVDASMLRRDTPLSAVGWDSLARVCWEDAVADCGWSYEGAASAGTVGDLIDACRPAGGAR